MEKQGVFYAVSVGPGDPELLTLKAVRCLECCPVLAAPQTASGRMLALDIARGAADLRGKTILPLHFVMSREEEALRASHQEAAEKVRACLDAAVKLGATGYVFWGGREGYDTLLNTDMGLELDNMARFLRMARDYGRKIGFTGDFYLEPKPKEPTKHQYDFDVATCMNFLRKYDLTADFKMNIEANHATLAGHTFEHELRTAIVNGSFGSIDANEGDYLLGWDTDQFPANVYSATYCMMEVLRAGGFTNGGLNFDAKARRQSNTFEDILLAYISGMDTFALGLRKALELKADGRLDQFVKERYSSYDSGVGKKIVDGEMTLESLADYAEGLKSIDVPSGRQEYLESVVNRVLFH